MGMFNSFISSDAKHWFQFVYLQIIIEITFGEASTGEKPALPVMTNKVRDSSMPNI